LDKNVSGVDLDELLKAREELNKEIGVETDPNMYSDYNPNRKNEENEKPASDENEESFVSENSDVEDSKSETQTEEPKLEDGYTEETKKEETSVVEHSSSAGDNLQKFDMFSAFEVKENVHESAGEKLDFNKLEDSSQRTTNLEKLETELMNSSNDEEDSDVSADDSAESKFEEIENADELGSMLDQLLADLDAEDEEAEEKTENSSSEETVSETIQNESSEAEEENDDASDLADSYLTSLDIEPKFEEPAELADVQSDETEVAEEEQPEEEKKADRLDLFMKGNLSSNKSKSEEDEISETENSEESKLISALDDFSVENLVSDEGEETQESSETEEEASKEESDETQETTETENAESENEVSENKEPVIEIEDEEDNSYLDVLKSSEPEQEKQESVALESYDATKASPNIPKKSSFENSLSDGETEIITDYNQLREILQRELKESEEASQEKVEEDDDGVKYEIIEEFKFLDEIATDEFKNSDKFSYIMGKNEKGEMVYGNFKEHFNLAVFGKNDIVMNSFLNSMVLSLCLKNSTSDVNFVMLDSNINSTFEVYNKSSYLYFNRIAKTNKEILDTLIEVTKELDARYERLAEAGMSNADQFNDMAKETETTPMTNLIVVFNNYTDASQATYVDKINACLYQILKFGRLVGIYAVVTAMLPITTSQVNYNLSSRISFKSDHESKYTVGVEGVHKLPDESDAIYFNISKNTSEHIKAATVTDTELDIIIKELEDEDWWLTQKLKRLKPPQDAQNHLKELWMSGWFHLVVTKTELTQKSCLHICLKLVSSSLLMHQMLI